MVWVGANNYMPLDPTPINKKCGLCFSIWNTLKIIGNLKCMTFSSTFISPGKGRSDCALLELILVGSN